MIDSEQKDQIIKILGKNYLLEIQKYLNELGITSYRDQEYSTETIRRIIHGVYENPKIENAIIDLWEAKLEEIQQNEDRKKMLLKASQKIN
ncbi:hypothetical protein [Nonlabens tegetincola]|uniref:hypothetical protein n=1 Tax=Nonlabens tegetincola TaxID=323273 RepID=UPI0005AB45C4|nr:hypothetical protein [Nonlabens tegetincola]